MIRTSVFVLCTNGTEHRREPLAAEAGAEVIDAAVMTLAETLAAAAGALRFVCQSLSHRGKAYKVRR